VTEIIIWSVEARVEICLFFFMVLLGFRPITWVLVQEYAFYAGASGADVCVHRCKYATSHSSVSRQGAWLKPNELAARCDAFR